MEEVLDLARQLHLEVDSVEVQELLDSHNHELTVDELIEMHEQEQDIEELDPVQSEDRMAVGNVTEGSVKLKKGLQILENTVSNDGHIFSTKQGITFF
ncbi:hypothetical protein TNCV_3283931 [Trichonephila clavipes]|nr:hypothetical protein TNCV_3283931 [Trichonephila clavipes]